MTGNEIIQRSTEQIAKLSQKRAAKLAECLFALARHADSPQWIHSSAEGILIDLVNDQHAQNRRKAQR
jgi:hypothetical protein